MQPLIQWVPLGGSGWLFASFLLKQDWLQVALTFPVTLVTAVWAAYSRNFIERLSEIYGERAKQDANALVVWMDSLDQALKWQFSGFDGKYLKQQAKLFQEYTTEGFNPDRTTIPMLEEVFVPLELSGYLPEVNPRLEKPLTSPDSLNIWDLIRRGRKNKIFRQMVIQAQGGFGKTTLMRHIALIYGIGKQKQYQAPKLIPFLLYLRDLRELLDQHKLPTLPALITDTYLPSLSQSQPLQPPPQWAKTLLRNGKALIMFDGFDELSEPQRQWVSYWITRQMQEYSQSTFILTSRPQGYKDYAARRPTAPLFVQKFKPQQQRHFIERWYLCQERCARSERQQDQAQTVATQRAQNLLTQLEDPDRPELREMAQNPLLLNMLATYHRFDPATQLPRRRTELYQGMIKLQLDDRPRARGIPLLLPFEKSQQVLQSLAFAMVQRNRPTISQRQAITFFQKQALLQQEDVDAEAFLKQMVQVSELLVEREPQEYEFPHLSFQGFFAAKCLGGQKQRAIPLVLDNWQNTWWRETILLYTAQLSPRNLTQVIGRVKQLGKEAAQLAYDCLKEYRNPEKLDPALARELQALTTDVKTLRYQKLEEYLKNQQWREADQETYRLMITAVGKEEGQWFEPQELLNFPCDELLAIDGLWVKYSRGKWGFSVQKQIYVECGGTLDGSYPGNKIWHEFCDRVGWRKDKSYVSYKHLTFDLSISPAGEFPSKLVFSDRLPTAKSVFRRSVTWHQGSARIRKLQGGNIGVVAVRQHKFFRDFLHLIHRQIPLFP
ncbi:MAG: GUN4 domain-containing protein [Cyanobacteria bacterium]|nr:GUN4 domain-containing protein [Cyanobacteriota bacterium]